jgi:hypothetical protein
MSQHNLAQLEKQIKEVRSTLKNLADDQGFTEMLVMIHRPGWTTPAEAALVNGILDSMNMQATALVRLKQNLLEGSRLVSYKAGSQATT